MGILFDGENIADPSHLWMRRMLNGLGSDVAVLVCNDDPGDAFRQRFNVLVPRDDRPPLWQRAMRKLHLRNHCSPKVDWITKYERAMRHESVDAAFVHYLTSAVRLQSVWQAVRKPVFVHCHGHDATWDARHEERLDPHWERSIFKLPMHEPGYVTKVKALPDHVHFIANSFTLMQWLLDIGLSAERITVKHLGVEVPAQPRRRERKTSGLGVLYLGRLADFKGPDLCIRAFEIAASRGFEGTLTIAGDGALRLTCELMRDRSRYRERINLLGATDTATGERLRNEADIFTAHNCQGRISRMVEALGVSVLEAMASALPILSGRSGALPEVVEDGRQGILFPPEDIEAHAGALLRLRDPDLRGQMGESAWERACSMFSIEREISQLRNILGISVAQTADAQSGRQLESCVE